jgi:hypothetical protein
MNTQFTELYLRSIINLAFIALATTCTFNFNVNAQTLADRAQAATDTATNNPLCVNIRPFYWEIGDANDKLKSGSFTDPNPYPALRKYWDADTTMTIASASKWIYSAYVAERLGVNSPYPFDIAQMFFISGYNNLSACSATTTVAGCVQEPGRNPVANPAPNGQRDDNYVGQFFYDGAHMQVHAANRFLLANKDRNTLGTEIAGKTKFATGTLTYNAPQLAGGAVTTPSAYAAFLRRIISGQLLLGAYGYLGWAPVCAWQQPDVSQPDYCSIGYTPFKDTSWAAQKMQYSFGHWVEDMPNGQGTFSSPGALGFYPWINADQTLYGIVARQKAGGFLSSMKCGRVIRQAYEAGVAIP